MNTRKFFIGLLVVTFSLSIFADHHKGDGMKDKGAKKGMIAKKMVLAMKVLVAIQALATTERPVKPPTPSATSLTPAAFCLTSCHLVPCSTWSCAPITTPPRSIRKLKYLRATNHCSTRLCLM